MIALFFLFRDGAWLGGRLLELAEDYDRQAEKLEHGWAPQRSD